MVQNTVLKAHDPQYDAERMYGHHGTSEKDATYALKTTKTGIPLVPQPSDDPEDPLVRPLTIVLSSIPDS